MEIARLREMYSCMDLLVSMRIPARMGKSRREWKATILRGDLPLSRMLSPSSFRSLTGSPCASAAWKVRLTSSTETVKLYEGRG
jgi:hypothetical protein